jgi:hypothetical protein
MDGVPVEQVTADEDHRVPPVGPDVDADLGVGVGVDALGHGPIGRTELVVDQGVGQATDPGEGPVTAGSIGLWCVDAAGDQHVGPSGVGDPVAEALGQGWGEGQFGQDHDGRALVHGGADQRVQLGALASLVCGTDVEDAPVGSGGELQVGQGSVGVHGGEYRIGAQERCPRFGQRVVEHDVELGGPLTGQADVPGLVEAVRQTPRWRGGHQGRHRSDVRSPQRHGVAHSGTVGASGAEGRAEADLVLLIDEFSHPVSHCHDRHIVVPGEEGSQLTADSVVERGPIAGADHGPAHRVDPGFECGLDRSVRHQGLQLSVVVPAPAQQHGEDDEWLGLGGHGLPQGGESVGFGHQSGDAGRAGLSGRGRASHGALGFGGVAAARRRSCRRGRRLWVARGHRCPWLRQSCGQRVPGCQS